MEKEDYIRDLEKTVTSYEQLLKDNRKEMQDLEITLENKNTRLLEFENNFVNITELRQLQTEMEQKTNMIIELEKELAKNGKGEVDLDALEETEGLKRVLKDKENRVNELEDALRESIKIATERERVLHQEEVKRRQIVEKVQIFIISPSLTLIVNSFVRSLNWSRGCYLSKVLRLCAVTLANPSFPE